MIKLLFFILLQSSILFSQTSFENLQNEIAKFDDSLKIKKLIEYAIAHRNSDSQVSLLALDEALKISERKNNLILKAECLENLVKYYELKEDFRKAFLYLKKYETLKDSLVNKARAEKIYEIESKLNTIKKDKQTNPLYNDTSANELQRIFLIAAIVFALVVVSIIYKMAQTKKSDSEKLQKINKMKDTLIRLIAHDLKTPFTVIFGYTDILREDFNSINDEEKLMYLESIRKASRLSVQLLENLTMWSKSYTDKLELKRANINLSDAVRESIYLLQSTAEAKNISVISELDEDILIYADENMIKTVIRNLIFNGIKFTEEGGSVKVFAILLDKKIKITVEDNGIGMDDFTKGNLFNPDEFVSSEGTAGEKGTGFGLILCKEFVEKNGGKIWAESEIGKGSRFMFTVPVAAKY